MRGVNKVVISGNVTSDISFGQTRGGSEVCTFEMVSERPSANGGHRVYAKINVYMEALVAVCKDRLEKSRYVIVEGELMNRDGRSEELTEVRARDIIFTK
jgi:single-stranded DNA-binding protein